MLVLEGWPVFHLTSKQEDGTQPGQ